jgi:hypothetical protein
MLDAILPLPGNLIGGQKYFKSNPREALGDGFLVLVTSADCIPLTLPRNAAF